MVCLLWLETWEKLDLCKPTSVFGRVFSELCVMGVTVCRQAPLLRAPTQAYCLTSQHIEGWADGWKGG